MIPASSGGTICPPSCQYTLYPLYSGGLCEAVSTIPHNLNVLLQKRQLGVGLNSENKYTSIPFAEKTSATVLQAYHYFDDSQAITAFKGWSGN
jgi:hypothetical protein